MGARAARSRFSLEEFERLPDDPSGERREAVRGHLVREPPAGFEHGSIAAHVASLLDTFVRENRLGVVVGAETGFVLAEDPPVVRGPDAAFVAQPRLPVGTTRIRGFARLAPDLAVEVVSPSNAPRDIEAKVHDYLDAGVRLVWVLHPDDVAVRVYRKDGSLSLLTNGDTLTGEDMLPGFGIAVRELFT